MKTPSGEFVPENEQKQTVGAGLRARRSFRLAGGNGNKNRRRFEYTLK